MQGGKIMGDAKSEREIAGIIPILPAPFDEDERLDIGSFRNVIETQVRHGAHGVALFGLVTEYYKLSDEERLTLAREAVRAVDGRLPLVISVTEHATRLAVAEARGYQDMGADALMIMPPFFLGPGWENVRRHVEAVLEAVEISVILQYSPGQTGLGIDPQALAAISRDYPHLRYVKVECSPPGPYISRLGEVSGGLLRSFVGYAGLQMLDALERGAAGVMPSTPLTEVYRAIYDAYAAGDAKRAAALHARLIPLINVMMQTVEMVIAADKLLLKERGIIASDRCRKPSFELDGLTRRRILSAFHEISDLLA